LSPAAGGYGSFRYSSEGAARLRAIKADIAQNLAGDVNVAALSARHRLSERYIRKLFEGENTSLSQFVLSQRLILEHRMLMDPRHADCTISDIAFPGWVWRPFDLQPRVSSAFRSDVIGGAMRLALAGGDHAMRCTLPNRAPWRVPSDSID
jgi:hypothetical protein